MLPAIYLNPPRTRANLVQARDGAFIDTNGSSRGISNERDRQLLLELRKLADVVVTDGETARLEDYRIPRDCDLAVITRKGFEPRTSASEKTYLELRKTPEASIRKLLLAGYRRILVECGPQLVAKMIAGQLIDQLCLTNTGGSKAQLSALGIANAQLQYELVDGDTTFSVWSQIQAS
jgi:riboflavin biosynthesis pyrimidine reductase